jgi:hypothetical protein
MVPYLGMTAVMSHDTAMGCHGEPTERQIEAAAKAWMTWQFPGRAWEDAVPALQDKFREGAKLSLIAAADVHGFD